MPAGAVTATLSGGRTAALPVSLAGGLPNPLYDWTAILAARGLPALAPTGLLAGPRHGYQTHLLFSPGADRDEAAKGLRAALDEVGLPAVAMYLGTADAAALRQAGVKAVPVLLKADAWLRIPAGGWDAWLHSLGRNRRQTVRSDIRRFEAAGYEIIDAPLAEWTGSAADLLAGTEAKYGHGHPASFYLTLLTAQVKHLGTAGRVILCAPPGERPVGHVLYYVHGDTLYVRSAGFDYSRLRDAAEYFNVVFYLPLRRALEAGLRWMHAGIESTEAKALRGAELRPLWLLDVSSGSILHDHADAVRAANSRTAASISTTPFLEKSWNLGTEAADWFAPA
ncbi:GNAT family N-acetyltransferase [Nonomuraea lactucae]|uniref:GNAT family N-acetyltransferase n=1 Tax=Nonomuraea lactucae TaxID=2249762 RepID=UPI0013B41D6C|nr:GNAT family N-acetyltransferase [Nonomuraea lactucae]